MIDVVAGNGFNRRAKEGRRDVVHLSFSQARRRNGVGVVVMISMLIDEVGALGMGSGGEPKMTRKSVVASRRRTSDFERSCWKDRSVGEGRRRTMVPSKAKVCGVCQSSLQRIFKLESFGKTHHATTQEPIDERPRTPNDDPTSNQPSLLHLSPPLPFTFSPNPLADIFVFYSEERKGCYHRVDGVQIR